MSHTETIRERRMDELHAENERLRADLEEALIILTSLANAADMVGVEYFDTDTMDPLPEQLLNVTLQARAIVKKHDAK